MNWVCMSVPADKGGGGVTVLWADLAARDGCWRGAAWVPVLTAGGPGAGVMAALSVSW